jgi:aspartyl-tRNA(Asn)/glutamyl-tRNA(Gln) amidotransferase subunit A
MFSISNRPTIEEIHTLYRTKKAKPSEVIKFFYNRINELDKKYLAFDHLTPDFANRIAFEQDIELGNSDIDSIIKSKPLFGIPFGNKAIIQVEGEVFNAGSKILDNFKSPYSSTAYLKIEKAGAIMLGVCNMDSHAMGSSGETSSFAVSRNPFDTTRICGGSSSGSACVLSSGQAVFSLGTDTGGSIRQPASFNDLVGLKPTYGLVSRWGTQPMASSLDQVGPMSNCVSDNLLLTSVLAGKDLKDQTTIESSELIHSLQNLYLAEKSKRQGILTKSPKPLKIGIVKQFFIEGIDPVIRKAMDDIIKKLESLGHTLVDIDLPVCDDALAIYYMTNTVEVASNFQRIDGIRYAKQPYTVAPSKEELYYDHRNTFYPDEVKRRIVLGSYASSAGYFDAYYNQSQKVRAKAITEFKTAFTKCDIMIAPITPEFPFKIGEKSNDPIKMYLSDVFTCLINPIKVPSLAVPLGLFEYKETLTKVFDEVSNEDKKLPKQDPRSRAVAIINIVGSDKYIAFKKNSDSTEYYNDPNSYFLPGGEIEEGENPTQAGIRETLEEIGLQGLRYIKDIAQCQKLIRYQDAIANNHESYILFEVEQSDFDNLIESEATQKNYKIVTVTKDELRQNNWTQLNWILDILDNKATIQKSEKGVMLPTGCQIIGPELSEDILYKLAFEIEAIK